MDLVVQCVVAKTYSELAAEACAETHRRYIDGIGNIHFIEFRSHRQFLMELLMLASTGTVSGDFVLTKDKVVLTKNTQPLPYANHKGSWQKRKGSDTDVMVNTIRLLADKNCSMFDFESDTPCLMNAEELSVILMKNMAETYMIRTMYFSLMRKSPERIDDPTIPLWRYGFKPEGAIVALDDTCYANEECRAWIRKMIKDESDISS